MRMWLARARRMTPSDYVTAAEVVRLAVWVEVAIRMMPFARLLERVSRATSHVRSMTPAEFHRLMRFVAVAYEVLPLPATCLRRSIVLHALLVRRGAQSRFCLGVARTSASLDAHAWIECDGMTSDTDAGRFSELRIASQFPRTSPLSHI
jgi:hypothetical protein